MPSKYIWLFDPGHGGIVHGEYQTAGKRSPVLEDGRQLFEGVFNREIVRRLIQHCEDNTIDYVNLVDTQIDLPLRTRTDLANDIYRRSLQHGGRHCIYVSVHANAYTPTNKLQFNTANGWEVYTTPGETKSDRIANVFFNKMKLAFPDKNFRTDYADNDPDKEANFFVLRKTVMPAILTENFFMTNREEVELLLSDAGRDAIADAHFAAMQEIEGSSIV